MWPNPQFPADLVTYTEEILMEGVKVKVPTSFRLADV